MLRDNGNSPGNSLSQSWRRKKGCSEKDLRRRKVFSMEWKTKRVMDDESGESIEEEVSVNGMGELQYEVLVRSCRREAGSWFQRKMWTKSIAVSHAVFKAIAVCGTLLISMLEQEHCYINNSSYWLSSQPSLCCSIGSTINCFSFFWL